MTNEQAKKIVRELPLGHQIWYPAHVMHLVPLEGPSAPPARRTSAWTVVSGRAWPNNLADCLSRRVRKWQPLRRQVGVELQDSEDHWQQCKGLKDANTHQRTICETIRGTQPKV